MEGELSVKYICSDSIGIAYIAWLVRGRLQHPKRVANVDARVLTRTVRDTTKRPDIHTLMKELGEPFRVLPPFESHWFSGFVQIGGSFEIHTFDSLIVVVTATQKDPHVLDMIHAHFDLGGSKYWGYSKKYHTYTARYSSSSHANACKLVKYFDIFCCFGQRGVQYPVWRKAVLLMAHKRHLNTERLMTPKLTRSFRKLSEKLSKLKHAVKGSWSRGRAL